MAILRFDRRADSGDAIPEGDTPGGGSPFDIPVPTSSAGGSEGGGGSHGGSIAGEVSMPLASILVIVFAILLVLAICGYLVYHRHRREQQRHRQETAFPGPAADFIYDRGFYDRREHPHPNSPANNSQEMGMIPRQTAPTTSTSTNKPVPNAPAAPPTVHTVERIITPHHLDLWDGGPTQHEAGTSTTTIRTETLKTQRSTEGLLTREQAKKQEQTSDDGRTKRKSRGYSWFSPPW